MPKSTGQPRKRKSTAPNYGLTKRRRATIPPIQIEPSDISLLDLPSEIIDVVLSYVIDIPEHPYYATFPIIAIKHLFPSSAFHTSQYLRRRSIEYVSQNCLWIIVQVRSRSMWTQKFEPRVGALPTLPRVYCDLLSMSSHLALVNITIHEPGLPLKQTRRFNTNTTSLLFPFNYHSFAEVYSMIVEGRGKFEDVSIDCSRVPRPLHQIAQVQILPIVELLRFYANVKVVTELGVQDRREKLSLSRGILGREIDTVMSMVLDLDRYGRRLEASLLCMYTGYKFFLQAQYGDPLHTWRRWVEQMASFAGPDWQSNPTVQTRMRLVHTIHYIETRALHYYLQGFEEHGDEFLHHDFWSQASADVTRWVGNPMFSWFGLPDHELASRYHSLTLLYQHYCHLAESFPAHSEMAARHGIEHVEEAARARAVYYAFCAWNLCRQNVSYASILDESLNRDSSHMIELQRQLHQRSTRFTAIDGGQYMRVGDEDVFPYGDNLKYWLRAQQVARLADVAYDSRRGDELLMCRTGEPFDDAALELIFGSNQEYAREKKSLPLKWSAVGLDRKSLKNAGKYSQHEVVVSWDEWTPM